MKNSKLKHILLLFVTILTINLSYAQTRTVGLFINDTAKTMKGYTLFAPKQNSMTYLIDNNGQIVNEWNASQYPPGQSAYLLENGHLLRTCQTPGRLGTGGGEGGRIEEYNWNDSLVWYLDYSTTTYMQHHDIRILPNGNILMLVVEKKLWAEALAAGFNPNKFQPDVQQKGFMLPDCVIEIHPTSPSGGTVVWEWHVWDHLIQEYDSTKLNFGNPALHPELIDAAGDHKNLPLFWNHMNSIDYNPSLDQVLMSVRGNSEIWIIDHSTTTLQSKGHTGGIRGKGGDLLYRWGNPITYKAGVASDEKLFQQHDAEWIKSGLPGAGNITCFNNGLGRSYSTVDEITPAIDSAGNYPHVVGTQFGPQSLTWQYKANPPASLYALDISGAVRLPNGNTMIDDGPQGTFYEVTTSGEIVWKYINPVSKSGRLVQGTTIPDDTTHPGEKLNSVFRVYKYAPTYPGLIGKDLSPKGFVEIYPNDFNEKEYISGSFELKQNYPNPFNPETKITFTIPVEENTKVTVYDVMGNSIEVLLDKQLSSGTHSVSWNGSKFASGIYFFECKSGVYRKVIKGILIK